MWRTRKGLRMVHELKHHNEEMRWLSELFPLEDRWVDGEPAQRRLSEWCAAHPDDARALRYLAQLKRDDGLIEKWAAMGDARAMAEVSFLSRFEHQKFQLAYESFEKNDARGTYLLIRCFQHGTECRKNEIFVRELMERGADLGSTLILYDLAQNHEMEPTQRVRPVISFFGFHIVDLEELFADLETVFRRHVKDGSCGNAVFEVGEMLKGNIDFDEGSVFGQGQDPSRFDRLARAVEMYDRWCDLAREACVIWALFAKRM